MTHDELREKLGDCMEYLNRADGCLMHDYALASAIDKWHRAELFARQAEPTCPRCGRTGHDMCEDE